MPNIPTESNLSACHNVTWLPAAEWRAGVTEIARVFYNEKIEWSVKIEQFNTYTDRWFVGQNGGLRSQNAANARSIHQSYK